MYTFMDMAWPPPGSVPDEIHDYAEGSCWKSQHPQVYHRMLSPRDPGEVRWVYWCPDTCKEGMLTYIQRNKKSRKMSEHWLVGEHPYSDDSWWCFPGEEDAVKLLCSVLMAAEV